MLPFVAKLRIILFVTKRYNFALGGKNSMKNKKRMASLLLAGCMAFSAVPVAFAADAEQAAVAPMRNKNRPAAPAVNMLRGH